VAELIMDQELVEAAVIGGAVLGGGGGGSMAWGRELAQLAVRNGYSPAGGYRRDG
jgi:DUF917 family protein